jgi:hypothetical protein
MGRNIIWYSTADGSWGGCDEADLIILDAEDFTDDENETLCNGDEREVYRAVVAAAIRNRKYGV